MRLENPSAFQFYWVLIFVITCAYLYKKNKKNKIEKVIGQRLFPFLTRSVSEPKRKWKWILQIVAVSLFIYALARPQGGKSLQEVKSEGVELMILVDVSESMMADDLKPSRLDQVKAEMGKLIDLMPGNKTGLVAFAGSSALLSPLTNDVGAMKMYIESLTTQSVSSQGTNFQGALELAKESFEKGGITQDDQVKVTRVILIVSDGEDHEQGAIETAQKLAKDGIKIFTIAYGTEKGAAIPLRDGMGFLKGYKKDRKGQTIISTVNGNALKDLASAGDGSFYFSSFGGEHIRNLASDISKLEQKQFESKMATQYEEEFQVYLTLGLIFALLELFIGERRKDFVIWKGRFEVPPL